MEISPTHQPELQSAHNKNYQDTLQIVEAINQLPPLFKRRTRLTVNNSIGRIVIKVIDTQSDTVIKEMPPIELQRAYARIRTAIEEFLKV